MHSGKDKFEDFKYTYDNINSWINNIDNKISILLVFLVAILGYAFSINDKIPVKSMQSLIIIVAIILLVFSCLLCTFALKGRIKSKISYTSLLFFSSIAKMDRKEFFDRLSKTNEKQLTNDIKNQIYINSCICNKKFKLYNIALNCLIFAMFLILLAHIINIF